MKPNSDQLMLIDILENHEGLVRGDCFQIETSIERKVFFMRRGVCVKICAKIEDVKEGNGYDNPYEKALDILREKFDLKLTYEEIPIYREAYTKLESESYVVLGVIVIPFLTSITFNYREETLKEIILRSPESRLTIFNLEKRTDLTQEPTKA